MRERRKIAGFLALVIFLSALGMPIPAEASEIWPQKATAPFYCLDGDPCIHADSEAGF